MKLSWKIFFSTLLITTCTFSAGGYILVSSLFSSALGREQSASIDESKMLRYSLQSIASTLQGSDAETQQFVIDSIVSRSADETLSIQIVAEDLQTISQSQGFHFAEAMPDAPAGNAIAHSISQFGGKYYINTASTVTIFGDKKMYLHTARDISSVFSGRAEQFRIYRRLMLALLAANGLLVYLVSLWAVHSIKTLSRATRRIAGGQYDKRVVIQSHDEIGQLADDFNQMADSLETKIRALEETAQRQSDFIASFAHELKTPLTSVIGYADMLRSKKMSEENTVLAAGYIFSEGKRLESLSLKLLDLIVLQKRDFEMKPVNVRLLCESVGAAMFPLLNEKGVVLSVSAEHTAVTCEPDLIKTLLLNLLDNARKAVDKGGAIRLSCRRPGPDTAEFIVEDNGRGVSEHELTRITEAFYMVDKSRSRAGGGVGLGLAICSEIADLHGGSLRFESAVGAGTRAIVTLRG